MAVIGNAPFQGLVSGGNILDASIEGVDLSTSAIAARLGYTPVDPGAAVFSANPTISSGVANGVAYLNGSKVVTSNSSLTFDGSTFSINNGVTSASISLIGTYAGSGTVAFLNFQRVGGAVAGTLGYDDSINSIRFGTTTNHSTVFLQNNAEAMRLSNAGLSVGISSGAGYLSLGSNAGRAQYQYINFGGNAGGTDYGWQIGRSSTAGVIADGFYIYDIKSNTTRLAIDLSGNVGMGTVSPATRLEIREDTSSRNTVTNMLTLHNYSATNPYDGFGNGIVFKGLDYSNSPQTYASIVGGIYGTQFSTPQPDPGFSGILRFLTGTNGANTERMSISSTQMLVNVPVGIGTSSPAGILDAGGNTLASQFYFRNNGSYGSGGGGQTIVNVLFGGVNIASIANTGTGQRDGIFKLLDENVVKVSIPANAARGGDTYFNNGGNFGINYSAPEVKLEVNGGTDNSVVFGGRSDGGNGNNRRFNLVAFADGGGSGYGGGLKIQTRNSVNVFSDTVTVKSDGNVGIGTTNSTEKLQIYGTATGNGNQGPRINIQYSGTSGLAESLVRFLDFRGNANAAIGNVLLDDGVNTAAAALVLKTAVAGTLYERVRITANGNVGINTDVPGTDSKLDVVGNITIDSAFSSQYGICFRRGFETSDNLRIYAGDTGLGRTGGLRLTAYDGISFGTGSNTWQERVRITNAGHMIPAANDTYDLGGAGSAWRNIYTNDLHLNNESKLGGNDIDGTTGNWTIQEGADNLYIINNKTGKKYSFALKEVV